MQKGSERQGGGGASSCFSLHSQACGDLNVGASAAPFCLGTMAQPTLLPSSQGPRNKPGLIQLTAPRMRLPASCQSGGAAVAGRSTMGQGSEPLGLPKGSLSKPLVAPGVLIAGPFSNCPELGHGHLPVSGYLGAWRWGVLVQSMGWENSP